MKLRDYQVRALNGVRQAFRGSRSVVLVAPTGSGKTVMGAEVVRRTLANRPAARALWICHRRELRAQAQETLSGLVGGIRWSVETVQSLLAGGRRPAADLLVYDEAHHYRASQWGGLADAYPGAWSLGLTATPQRADGKGLGSMFGSMVVAAKHSELIGAGHLVPCRTLRPDRYLGSDGIAQGAAEAYVRHGEGRRAFVFVSRVDHCEGVLRRFAAEGIRAAIVTGETRASDRRSALAGFRLGDVRALINVYCLTEGIDVPEASCCVLARGVGHASQYLQIVGRIMRPAAGKRDGLLIDLSGASHAHGLPGQDASYSLEGDGIETTGKGGAGAPGECTPADAVKIHSLALESVYAGAETPDGAKVDEWDRLCGLAGSRGWGLAWAAKEYKKLFGSRPPQLAQVPPVERRREYLRFLAFARSRGHRDGQAAHRYKDLFGTWPPFAWRK